MSGPLLKALKALPPEPKTRVRVALAYREQTQTGMARAVGIDPGLLSNALSGFRDLSEGQEEAIAGFLDVPRMVLFPKEAVQS